MTSAANICKNGTIYDPLASTCIDKNDMAYEYALPSLLFLSKKNKKKKGMTMGVRQTLIEASLSSNHILLSIHGEYRDRNASFTVPPNVVIVFMTPASSLCWAHADISVKSRRQRRQMIWGHHDTVQSRTYIPGDVIADLHLSSKPEERKNRTGAFLLNAQGKRKREQLFHIESSLLSSTINRVVKESANDVTRFPFVFFVSACRGVSNDNSTMRKQILQQDLMALQRMHQDPLTSSFVGRIGKNISNTAVTKPHIRDMLTYYTREALSSSIYSKRGTSLDIQRLRQIRMTYLLSILHYQITWKTESIDESIVRSLVSIATKKDFKSWGHGGNPLTHLSLWYATYPLSNQKTSLLLSMIKTLSPSYQTRNGLPEPHQRMVIEKWWHPDDNYKFHNISLDTFLNNTYVRDIVDQAWKTFILGLLLPEYLPFVIHGIDRNDRNEMNLIISNMNGNTYGPNIKLSNMKRLTAYQFLDARLNSRKFRRYFEIALPYMNTKKSLKPHDVARRVLGRLSSYTTRTIYNMTFKERFQMVQNVIIYIGTEVFDR